MNASLQSTLATGHVNNICHESITLDGMGDGMSTTLYRYEIKDRVITWSHLGQGQHRSHGGANVLSSRLCPAQYPGEYLSSVACSAVVHTKQFSVWDGWMLLYFILT